MAQMFGAVVALVLFAMTGLSWATITAAVVATGLAVTSRRLFWQRR
jgi:hypothetical protein